MPEDWSFPSAHAAQVTAFALAWLLRPGASPGRIEIAVLFAAVAAGLRLAALPASPLSERCRRRGPAGDPLGPAACAACRHGGRNTMRHKFLGTGDAGYHPLRKIRTVFSGLRYAVLYDWSVTYKLIASVVVLAIAFGARAWVDFLLILVVTAFVLVAEIFNSAIEALCDFVETRHNEKIKVIKDIAAAGVGIAILVWIIVLGVELSRLLDLALP
jgi:diacylglycerol kinase